MINLPSNINELCLEIFIDIKYQNKFFSFQKLDLNSLRLFLQDLKRLFLNINDFMNAILHVIIIIIVLYDFLLILIHFCHSFLNIMQNYHRSTIHHLGVLFAYEKILDLFLIL